MKKYFVTTLLIASICLPVTHTFAYSKNLGAAALLHDTTHMQNQASHAAVMQQNRLTTIIHRADSMITTRITTLTTLASRIQHDTRLSGTEKTSLMSDIQTTTAGLTTLKAKIDADTDTTTAIVDTKQIVTNYYVYAILEPKIRLLIILNNMQTIVANVQALVPQLQNLIATLQSQGKDVTALQPLLSDVTMQLQTLTTTLTNDTTKVQSVSITTSTTDAHSTFTQIRGDMTQTVRSSFTKIQVDIGQMRQIFRQVILSRSTHPTAVTRSTHPTAVITLSVTPSPTITPTP